ncbi:uncharacterized protein LOC114273941 [Camellia sinensis]|uniref:uncharacterized protein LOC114273941 n=1 Tax=Camellia sinensis TaxID=4442 RepID=UPI00103566ED|nr:uncharacterized protein LOC114273941 [Camellia sinensis]
MRNTERCTAKEMADYTISWDAEGFRGEGDYLEYVRTYIMRPLSGGRRAERGGPAALVAGAGVGVGAGAPRVARGRGRSGARRGHGASWPALPVTMTCRGRGGGTYQIPIAPPLADHELVGFYGLPPASSEYTRQSLELTASVMGMLQQSLDLLAIYSIPVCFSDRGLKPYINCFTYLMHNTTLDTPPSRHLTYCSPQTVHSTIYGIYTVLIPCILHCHTAHSIHTLYLYTAFWTDILLTVFTHCIHTLHFVAY